MTRSLKALGLALVAALALTAVAASAASAHKLSTSSGGSVDVTATGAEAIFGVHSGILEVTCDKETFSSTTVANGATTVTVTPKYEECTAEPFGPSPVDVNGCDYLLHGNTTSSPNTTGGTKTDMPADLVCPAGQSIKVTAPGCTITIGPQNGLHGVGFTNEGSGTTADIKVLSTVDNISYSTPGGFVCSLGGLKAAGTDGFLTGNATAKGYTPHSAHGTGNHVGISLVP